MTSEEILTQWQTDCQIDRNVLDDESVRVSTLHAKYMSLFFKERVKLLNAKKELATYKLLRHEYWNGTLAREDLSEHGWAPAARYPLKAEIPMYLEADSVLAPLELRVGYIQEKVNLLDSIVKHIGNRNWQIRNILEWTKFTAGV